LPGSILARQFTTVLAAVSTRNALRAALVGAAIGAVIVVLNLFATGFRVFCLVVIVIAALVALPEGRREGGTWWWLLAGGAAASVLGAILAQPSTTLGGWLALLGGLAVVIGATIGFPREEE
jgi:hypothetical protein